ncbi:3-hydroxyacyl-CoA dehydrogenase NAD-binding domain-containing protein [Frankia sp. CiP1_Cm_nod2]|uniref:3-hydroxyacyl-CoA dehydrogenase NAD-binding domain-containing protein n=3 Tax=unclassified Frankia TaxID=2632575 RepID=UPI00202496AD
MAYTETIQWAQDPDGVVVLTLDDPQASANTLNRDFVESLQAAVDRLGREKETITGVVLTSAKKTFFAGGNLNELKALRKEDAAEFTAHLNRIKGLLRALETFDRPVVAAFNGAALGGGLELGLATHHRIAADVPGNQIGLPEVGLGLLPGCGGVVRTVRTLGVVDALNKVLLPGTRFSPADALEAGLVDEVVASIPELLPRAKEWIQKNPEARQPWDVKGFQIPGGAPDSPSLAPVLPSLTAKLRAQLGGSPLQAPRAIVAAAVEGAQVDVDTASLIETRYLIHLATGQVAKNLIQAFFFDTQHIKAGGSRPAGFDRFQARKVGVLGAGMMGAGIAYAAAKAGIEVVLKDVSLAAAERGKAGVEKTLSRAVAKGKTSQEQADAVLGRILPTEDPADFAGVDFVVEAVFESAELKHKVFGEIEEIVDPDAVLGSNTSTLPITLLAQGVQRPEDFIGIHFFSPVDRMALVEIIKGERTSERTLARVFDFVQQIRKTPIVVNDSRGFFTSRVIIAFLNEAVAAVGDGIAPASIEQAALQAGYPAGALQLIDELTLTLPRKIRQEARAAVEAAGGVWKEHAAEAVIDRLIDEFGRPGRSGGAGFYEYDGSGRRQGLWPGLHEAFRVPGRAIPFEDLKERLLFAETLEAVRARDEGVITSIPDANIGSLFGIGFPSWTGGVFQYINQYKGGTAGFVARANELAERYGERFTPPESLVRAAAAGASYE